MHVVAIIQARMGSTRFPGKVLRLLAGKPVLWHIVHRLHKCRALDAIAIATSDNPADDPLQAFAEREGIELIRGSEDNVLARYALTAERMKADIIVRVTGDAPLVDPEMIDRLIETMVENKADYCTGEPEVPCIHEGFCPFTCHALKKLLLEAGDDPVAKEHITAYFKKYPDFVRTTYVPIDPDYQFSGARVSVDTPADLRFLEEVYARLQVPAGEADMRDVVRLLRAQPELLKINSHIHRKKAEEKTRRALIRCDGDTQLGLGHVYRCLALTDELREVHGWGVSYAMIRGEVGFELVQQAGYPIEQKKDDNFEDFWLEGVVSSLQPDVLILDIRSSLTRKKVAELRRKGLIIATIDDPSERRIEADLAFYPPVPQVERLNWEGFTGDLFIGWEYVLLREEFSKKYSRPANEIPMVLVTMGGSDPAGLTIKVLKALQSIDSQIKIEIIIGPGFSRHDELKEVLIKMKNDYRLHNNPANLAEIMAKSDLAIASFGVTAYELAAVGVPAIYLCLTEDHAESATMFENAGIGKCLGLHTNVNNRTIMESVMALLEDNERRIAMSNRSKMLVDGKGASIVAELIVIRTRGKYAGN